MAAVIAAGKPETPLRRAPLGLCVDCLREDELRARSGYRVTVIGSSLPAMSKPVLYGILGGLAWFVLGILVGHYVWT